MREKPRLSSLLRELDAGRGESTAQIGDDPTPARPEGAPLRKPGDVVDRYVIESLLGRGGMGEVYAASDQRLGRRVALKLVEGDRDSSARARALREARAAAAFEHPNAVLVLDVGEAGSVTFLAMELIEGATLRSLLNEPVPIARRIRWLADVARALAAAHRVGLVHRDVKPDNVMIRTDGVAKVLDFGIARRQRSNTDPSSPPPDGGGTLTAAGVVVGTPLYLSPEQLRNEEIDGRADQFAWAVTAYEVLAGSLPWRGGDNLALVSQILSARVPPLREVAPSVPEEVDRVVLRALSNDPSERFATMDDVAAALEPFAEGATAIPRDTDGSRVARPSGRWGGAAVAAALLAGVGVAAAVLHDRAPALPPSSSDVAAAPVVHAVSCAPANVSGKEASAELTRAIGLAACMRVAVEIGIAWGEAPGRHSPLGVRATLDPAGAAVVLSLAGREVEGTGATVIDAVSAAASELAARVAAPDVPADQIAALGAGDAAGARKVARVWRRVDYRIAPDPEAELERVAREVPTSPWPWLLLANQATERSEALRKGIDGALARLHRLPASHADAIRGYAALIDRDPPVSQALADLRRAFMAAPDDPDVGVLHAVALSRAGPRDEALAALTRLMSSHPTRSVPAARQALFYLEGKVDTTAKLRLHDHLAAALPESRGWHQCVMDHLMDERVGRAQDGIDLARALGTDRADPRARFARADVALASFRPEEAQAIGASALAEPHPKWSGFGAVYLVASYVEQGRFAEARSAQLGEIDRLRGSGNPLGAAAHALRDLKIQRWLGQPGAGPEHLAWMESTLVAAEEVSVPSPIAAAAEVILARARLNAAGARNDAAAGLAALAKRIDQHAAGDPTKRDSALLATLPLVRMVRGDAAAARLWRDAEHASDVDRRGAALDAALVLEAMGDREQAARAYELARHPALLPWDAFSVVAAEVRLARLEHALGRRESAERREQVVARAWTSPDRDARSSILGMR